MDFVLKIPYKQKLSRMVTSFVEEAAEVYGASAQEKMQTALASEEIFSYIVHGYPPEETGEFNLVCRSCPDGIELIFSSEGIPINARQTYYETVDVLPEKLNQVNLDNLSLNLARKMTDKLKFVNCGEEGWQISLYKQFDNFNSLETFVAPIQEDTSQLESFILKAEDVAALIKLTYLNYRYGYEKKYFYDDDLLAAAIEKRRVYVIGIRNQKKELAGAACIFFESENVAEIGGIMTNRHYSRQKIMRMLIANCKKFFKLEKLAKTYFFIKQDLSVKAIGKILEQEEISFWPLCVDLSIAGRDDGRDNRFERRNELYAVYVIEKNDERCTVSIPERQREMVLSLLEPVCRIDENARSMKIVSYAAREPVMVRIATPEEKLWQHLSGHATRIKRDMHIRHQFVCLRLEEMGEDFAAILKKETFQIQQEGMLTCQLRIPMVETLPIDFDEIMEKNRYFFCGIHLNIQRQPELVYANLFHQKFDFDKFVIYGTAAKRLLKYVKKEYELLYE